MCMCRYNYIQKYNCSTDVFNYIIHTGDSYTLQTDAGAPYGAVWVLPRGGVLTFGVRACAEVRLAVCSGRQTDRCLELVVGAELNSKTVIRDGIKASSEVHVSLIF